MEEQKKIQFIRKNQNPLFGIILLSILISATVGALFGFMAAGSRDGFYALFSKTDVKNVEKTENTLRSDTVIENTEDNTVVSIVEKSSPAVVSIIISKDIRKIQQQNIDPFQFFFGIPSQNQERSDLSTRKEKIGAGSGFLVTHDGMIVTNKHVVSDLDAEYIAITSDGKEYPVKILARDSVLDIAIIDIEAEGLPILEMGNSEEIKVGQTVIAIGNSLAEFSNTVSKGVISGLRRNIVAGSNFGSREHLSGIIQTDTAINQGNSGGPLIDISGRVIGVNTAMAEGAQNIGFALPIDRVKTIVEEVQKTGKISVPFLGVRYIILDKETQDESNLPFDYGALVVRGEKITDFAVQPGSPADIAGIVENDIILEINKEKVTVQNQLVDIIRKQKVDKEVMIKVWHKGEIKDVSIILKERGDEK